MGNPYYASAGIIAATNLASGGTGNAFSTNEQVVEMHPKLWKSYPAVTPFLSDLSRLAEDTARQTTIRWGEHERIPDRFTVVNNATTGTSVIVQAQGPTLVAGSVLWSPEFGDYATVDSTPTTNTVTVTRSALGSTAVSWPPGTVLIALMPKSAENETATYRTSMLKSAEGYNYTQLSRFGFELTITANNTSTVWGGPGSLRNKYQNDKLFELKCKHENDILFSARSTGGTAPATLNYMGGICDYLMGGTLYKDFTGGFTESGFRGYLGNYFDQNPDVTGTVPLYTSSFVIEMVSMWDKDKVRISPESKVHGFDTFEYLCHGRRINLIPMPLMVDPITKGYGFIFDMERIAMKFPPEGRLKLMMNCKKAPEQGELLCDLYRLQFSLMVASESRHAMFVGANLL
jgi:hypothetical protein